MPTTRDFRIPAHYIEWKASRTKVWNSGPLSKNTFKSTRLAGVEWEYNHIISPKENHSMFNTTSTSIAPVKTWARKWHGGNNYDGSCGYEIVTAPMAGDKIAQCLTELNKAMIVDSVTTANRDCSVHVHVSVKDYEWDDMYRLIEIYSKFEKLLYAIGGDGRFANDYCSPCGDRYLKALQHSGEAKKEKVLAVTFKENDRNYLDGFTAIGWSNRCRKKDGGRYKGLNIIPWIVAKRDNRKDCTVEFRIHENTLDVNRVIGWVHLLVKFVDWCKKAKKKDIKSLPKNQIKALIQICPDSEDFINTRINAWKLLKNKKLSYNRGVFTRSKRKTKAKKDTNVVDTESFSAHLAEITVNNITARWNNTTSSWEYSI